MEVYVPYIVGSTVSAFLGKVAYSYFSYDKDTKEKMENSETLEINKTDYELIDNKGIKEKYWKPLGVGMSARIKAMKEICRDECGFDINDKKKQKERTRMLVYISQYEKLGHDDFVNKYIKKWKVKELNIPKINK
jgi:hypothetical protein